MEQPTPASRKKFLWWGAAIAASFTGLRFFSKRKQESIKEESETVKMLTQDGRLVAIDKNLLGCGKQKISNEELKQWVNKKPGL